MTIFDINCRVSYLSDKTGMSVTSLSDDLYYISLYLTIGYIEGVYWVSISSLSFVVYLIHSTRKEREIKERVLAYFRAKNLAAGAQVAFFFCFQDAHTHARTFTIHNRGSPRESLVSLYFSFFKIQVF